MTDASMRQLAATPLVPLTDCSEDGNGAPHLDSAIYLNKWLLDLRLKVSAAEVERHRMLRDAIHAYVANACYGTLEGIVDEATDSLYNKLMAKETG